MLFKEFMKEESSLRMKNSCFVPFRIARGEIFGLLGKNKSLLTAKLEEIKIHSS